MDTPEKKPKIPKQGIESEDKSKKRSEEIARMIHPHDDEPDPTAHMGNYNFPQMLFAFCLGFCGRRDWFADTLGQRLLQIRDDVVNVLDADGQADCFWRHTNRRLLLFAELTMGS